MTSSELKQILKDSTYLTPSQVLEFHCRIALVDALEQIREEMVTRMPLVGERGTNNV